MPQCRREADAATVEPVTLGKQPLRQIPAGPTCTIKLCKVIPTAIEAPPTIQVLLKVAQLRVKLPDRACWAQLWHCHLHQQDAT